MKIWTLHGFLGLPSDWNFLKNVFPFDALSLAAFPIESLMGWASNFNDFVATHSDQTNLLLGYSLGGRLAMHALIDRPELWSGAILISSHPGLQVEKDRILRRSNDQEWAKRFLSEPWHDLMNVWNHQTVFTSGTFFFDRLEENYCRADLSKFLINCSLGRQLDFLNPLKNLKMPILWLTGDKDIQYCQLAERVAFSNPLSVKKTIFQAGHRLPWEKPSEFIKICHFFLSKIGYSL
jgi:2-succinyl-6-hydroxy-2,4-cyclohexadiene-1-carboxylate synthase